METAAADSRRQQEMPELEVTARSMQHFRAKYRSAEIMRWKMAKAKAGRGACSRCGWRGALVECVFCEEKCCHNCTFWENNQMYLLCGKCEEHRGHGPLRPTGLQTRSWSGLVPRCCEAFVSVARSCDGKPEHQCWICRRWLCPHCCVIDDVARCVLCPLEQEKGIHGVDLKAAPTLTFHPLDANPGSPAAPPGRG